MNSKDKIITKIFLREGRTDSRELNSAIGWDFRKGVSDWRKWFRAEFNMTGTDEKYDPILPVSRGTNNEYKLKPEAYKALVELYDIKSYQPKMFEVGIR